MKKAKEIYDREASIHSGASNIQENLGKSESILDDSQKILKNKLVRKCVFCCFHPEKRRFAEKAKFETVS